MRERQPATSARSADRQAVSRAAPATPRPLLSPSSAGVLALQRAAGNAAVTGGLQRLRAAEEHAARARGGRATEPGGGVARVPRPSSPVPVLRRVIHQEPSYVAKGGGKTSLTNRGDIDIEERDGNVYVRVYQTVFAPVMGDSGHKDVHQGPDGSIDFRNQRDSAWLNMGRPWRAMHYMRTYQWQKNRDAPGGFAPPTARTTPLVRSFLVPLETYRRVTENAVGEKQINSVDDPRNMNQSTDKAKDSDQYQIRGAWMSEVAATALAGSLVTYAPDQLTEELRREPRHGSVEPLSALLGRLSMPDPEDFPEYRPAGARQGPGLLLPLDNQGKMPDDRAQRKHIERLDRLLSDAFPDDGNTGTRQVGNARAELERFWGRPGDVDWEVLHDRVRRAMNYAGMPAVLAEVFGTAEVKAALPGGGGFRVRDFGGTAAPAGTAAGHRRKPPRSGGSGARRAR